MDPQNAKIFINLSDLGISNINSDNDSNKKNSDPYKNREEKLKRNCQYSAKYYEKNSKNVLGRQKEKHEYIKNNKGVYHATQILKLSEDEREKAIKILYPFVKSNWQLFQ